MALPDIVFFNHLKSGAISELYNIKGLIIFYECLTMISFVAWIADDCENTYFTIGTVRVNYIIILG